MIGPKPDRRLQMPDRVVPVGLVHEAAAVQRLGEEALEAGEPLHLGVPGAEDVMRIVVGGVDLHSAGRFVVDDLGVADALLAAFRA